MDLVAEKTPWVVYDAAQWLRETIKSGQKVFEWGSGGSTTFFLSRGAHLVTVEHDPSWVRRVREYVQGYLHIDPAWNGSWQLVERPPTVGVPVQTPSMRWPSGCFQQYANSILQWPDKTWDMVFVDGRARNECARLAASRVRPGGWLVLDNSDRDDYQPTFDLLSGWRGVHFQGHGPLSDLIWKTSCWQRPE